MQGWCESQCSYRDTCSELAVQNVHILLELRCLCAHVGFMGEEHRAYACELPALRQSVLRLGGVGNECLCCEESICIIDLIKKAPTGCWLKLVKMVSGPSKLQSTNCDKSWLLCFS